MSKGKNKTDISQEKMFLLKQVLRLCQISYSIITAVINISTTA